MSRRGPGSEVEFRREPPFTYEEKARIDELAATEGTGRNAARRIYQTLSEEFEEFKKKCSQNHFQHWIETRSKRRQHSASGKAFEEAIERGDVAVPDTLSILIGKTAGMVFNDGLKPSQHAALCRSLSEMVRASLAHASEERAAEMHKLKVLDLAATLKRKHQADAEATRVLKEHGLSDEIIDQITEQIYGGVVKDEG